MDTEEPEITTTRRVLAGNSFATLLRLPEVLVVCTAGPDHRREWILKEPVVRIGTGPNSTLVLTDSSVSRSHALLKQTKDGWLVENLGSTNGVFVDGVRVESGYLKPQSVIQLGTTTLMVSSREDEVLAPPINKGTYEGLVAENERVRELIGVLKKVAPLNTSILLTGPTGCGKGKLARTVHKASRRATKPFLVLDCANVDANLIRAELFGYERGAFTGAEQMHKGVFEEAEGGTVFIDEIGELPLDLQPRLLRVIEDREICRLGSRRTIPVDVRIVSATHRNLRQMVKKELFRADLFYRLCVVEVEVPSLAARREDIGPLARQILDDLGATDKWPLSRPVLSAVMDYPWPGNIRELRNALERGVALAGDATLEPHHLKLDSPERWETTGARPEPEELSASAAEAKAVERVLRETEGNLSRAARILGIALTTLKRRMHKHGIKIPARPIDSGSTEVSKKRT